MSKADDYRQFANECIQWARSARSEDEATQLLDLAKLWMTAATEIDDGIVISAASRNRNVPKGVH